MIKVITLSQKKEWNFYVKNAFVHDFYHTWHYHVLDRSGIAILLVYEENQDYIAFPFLKRKIPNSSFFDLSSVYGYVGPIASKENQCLSDALINNFKKAFLNFLKDEHIVSVFSRLHPFFDQDRLIASFNGTYENGKTVVLDLTLPIEFQRKKYNSSAYDSIKKSWKRGFSVRETKQEADINTFIDIYLENMQRVSSTEYYLFSRQYFFELINSSEYDCRLLLVCSKNEVIGGMILTFTHDIIQAHLLATKMSYLSQSPIKFLIDEITLIGRKEEMKYLHLGGGIGFKEDSLFKWKSLFSDFFLDYKSLRYIANRSVYRNLVKKQGIDEEVDIDFFPLYRAVVKVLACSYFQLIV